MLQRRGEVEEALGGLALAEPLQGLGVKAAGEQRGAALGRGLAEEQVPGQGGELPQHGADVLAALIEFVQLQERRLGVPLEDGLQQLYRLQSPGEAQGIQHGLGVQVPARRRALVE